jgi:hypothetical protein
MKIRFLDRELDILYGKFYINIYFKTKKIIQNRRPERKLKMFKIRFGDRCFRKMKNGYHKNEFEENFLKIFIILIVWYFVYIPVSNNDLRKLKLKSL